MLRKMVDIKQSKINVIWGESHIHIIFVPTVKLQKKIPVCMDPCLFIDLIIQ